MSGLNTAVWFVITLLLFVNSCPPEANRCEQCCCYLTPYKSTYCIGEQIHQIPRINTKSTVVYIDETYITSVDILQNYLKLKMVTLKKSMYACASFRKFLTNNPLMYYKTDCPMNVDTTPQQTVSETTVSLSTEISTTSFSEILSETFSSESKTMTTVSSETVTILSSEPSVLAETSLGTKTISTGATLSSESDTFDTDTTVESVPSSVTVLAVSSVATDMTFSVSNPPPPPSEDSLTGQEKSNNDEIILATLVGIVIILATAISVGYILRRRRINRRYVITPPPSRNRIYNPHSLVYDNVPFETSGDSVINYGALELREIISEDIVVYEDVIPPNNVSITCLLHHIVSRIVFTSV